MHSSLRRTVWRLGRRLYCAARGEPVHNLPERNGELALAQASIVANADTPLMTILDVGANIGDWTRPVLDRLQTMRPAPAKTQMFLFEPAPETRAHLVRNLSQHPLGQLARVEAFALSDQKAVMKMAIFDPQAGIHTLVTDGAPAKGADHFESVDCIPMADFAELRGLDHIHLIKVDTEGHDLSVLKGAMPLLRASRIDVIQFEYNHRWIGVRAFLKDVFDLVEGLPYTLGRVTPGGVETFAGWHPELERFFEANYVLVRNACLAGLETRPGAFDKSNSYATL